MLSLEFQRKKKIWKARRKKKIRKEVVQGMGKEGHWEGYVVSLRCGGWGRWRGGREGNGWREGGRENSIRYSGPTHPRPCLPLCEAVPEQPAGGI